MAARGRRQLPPAYISPEVAGAQQTAAAQQRASSAPKEPLSPDTSRKQTAREQEALLRRLTGVKLGFLLKKTGDLSKMLMVTIALLFLGSFNVVSVSLFSLSTETNRLRSSCISAERIAVFILMV